VLNGISELSERASAIAQSTQANSPSVPVDPTREAFDDFVGQTFFGQMLKAMRSTVGKPAYFHGGQAEEIFRGQLDQVLVERMSDATAETFTGPMFELFQLRQR